MDSRRHATTSPFCVEWIDTGDGHRLYVEQSGSPTGIPVVYCHGGPGGCSSSFHRTLFDSSRYRIVLFDQRGCGQSSPTRSLHHNDTAHLVADMERIRQHLGLEAWVVTGGSWGSTLALAYGQEHPTKCLGFILRGIFLGREEDIRWLYWPDGGASQVFPDFYRDFAALLQGDLHNPVASYQRLLTSDDAQIQLSASKAWSLWESRIACLEPHPSLVRGHQDAEAAMTLALLENHYFMHQCFLAPDQLLSKVSRIAHLPCYLVHGRYDMVCKAENAWRLAERWPLADLNLVADAGHSVGEIGISAALYRASVLLACRLETK